MAGLDLLPYLIAAGAAGTGATSLVLTAGDNGGWPAVPGDTVIVAGGSGGAQATGVTDSASPPDTYTQPTGAGTSVTPVSWLFTGVAAHGLKAPGPGITPDTITVSWAGTGQAKQVVAMGCANLGAVDAAVTAHTTGTSTTPSVTSGVPAQAGELIAAVCLFQNAGGAIAWAPGWREIAHITSGSNAIASLAVMVNPTAAAVSPSGTLSGTAVAWSMTVVGLQAAPQSARGTVGASVFKAAYPNNASVSNDTQAKKHHDTVVGRTSAMRGCKRYLDEAQYESAASPGQNTVSLTQSGIQCLVSVKPTRAVGGGTAGDITSLRAMLTYWKNNGVAPLVLLWNEANLGGAHSAFGDGTFKGITSPYGAPGQVTAAQAASNYQDYFAYYAPTVLAAGIQCFYNACLASPISTITFIPPRWNGVSGYCTGIVADIYMTDTSASYPAGTYKATLDDLITACQSVTPLYPLGIGETGATDGTSRPLTDNPAGTAQWIDGQLTAKLVGYMLAGGTVTFQAWFANGTGNALNNSADGSATDARIIAAYQRWFDATDSSATGAPSVTTTSPLPDGTVGAAYDLQLSSSGGTAPYTWAITAGALPAGLVMNTAGHITGTPATAQTLTFTAQVTDSLAQTGSAALTLAIDPVTLLVPAQPLPPGTQGAPYSTAVTATGGTPPYTFALATGALPAGLALAADGTISGTPTTAGTATFTVQATDHASATATSPTLTITVATGALAITTTTLPAAIANTAYNTALAAAGGTPPYTWAVTAGSLPPGIALGADGTIAGIPAGAGTFTFTAQVTDAAAATASAALAVTVTAVTVIVSPGPWRMLLAAPQPGGTYLAEIAQAQNRTITLRTEPDQQHEASFTILGDSAAATGILELQTDVQVLYGSSIVFCGRIGPTQDTLDASGHHLQVTAYDYREVLRRRAILPGDTLSYTSIEQAAIAWNLIQATQARSGGNLGIAQGAGQHTGTTRTMTFTLGDYIGDSITTMAQLANGFEWQITPYGAADLRLDIFYPEQGSNRGAVLSPGDGRVSSVVRAVDPSTFANALYETGDSGSALTAQFTEGGTATEGRWDKVIGTSLKTQSALNDSAAADLAAAQVLIPAYTITFYPGTWNGPADIWIGDTVTVQITSGRLAVNEQLRVMEMSFALSADGTETLTLTAGALPLRLLKKIPAILRRLRYLETR